MGISNFLLLSFQSACQQELDKVLEEISKMTSEDNRGPLENLYGLKFPNCDRHGLYNLKQVSNGHSTGLNHSISAEHVLYSNLICAKHMLISTFEQILLTKNSNSIMTAGPPPS